MQRRVFRKCAQERVRQVCAGFSASLDIHFAGCVMVVDWDGEMRNTDAFVIEEIGLMVLLRAKDGVLYNLKMWVCNFVIIEMVL